MMRRVRVAALLALILSGIPGVIFATDYTSSNFKVKDPVVEELGGYATSSSFGLFGSIPYISPRRGSSSSFGNQPGFLSFSGTSSGTTTTSTPTSNFSGGGGVIYPPGAKPKVVPALKKSVDFNRDGFVNFIDFSILLYYFDKTGSSIEQTDLNSDGVVDLTDVSIFMYYWDGSDDQKVATS